MKRYYDLSEGIPTEALNLIECLKALSGVGGSHIQRLIDVYTRGKELIIVLDTCQEGAQFPAQAVPGSVIPPLTLDQVFNNNQMPYYKVSEKIAKVYLWEILQAVKTLHQKGYTHRNINMASFIVTNPIALSKVGMDVGIGTLMLTNLESSAKQTLSDYEISGSYEPSDGSKQMCADVQGPSSAELQGHFKNQQRHYLAPELLLGQTMHTFATDMWAVGCIMFRMLCGYHPFIEDSYIAVLILECPSLSNEQRCPWFCSNVDKFPQWQGMMIEELMPPETSPAANDLLQHLLHVEPSNRISAELALMHPLFNDLRTSSDL
ncbi:hypothetical protein FGO68_gene5014 [Halteria grandinella]|uniref:Protein kinase domain-containing protein n=1 Tax=Halteria grandinella TaxID=5974 RepID=A0A8J8NP93_HALGN|nr:hypothetical protein FGO68_gene5014 [Halteria grandinella]